MNYMFIYTYVSQMNKYMIFWLLNYKSKPNSIHITNKVNIPIM